MIYALIVAAGKGSRIGSDTPKQFLNCKGNPILTYTIKAFEDNPKIGEIVIVTSFDYIDVVKNYIKLYNFKKVSAVIPGGDTRQLSVFSGLNYISNNCVIENDYVLIHDGARPLVSQEIINANCEALKTHECVCTVINDTDTTYFSQDGSKIDSIMDRNCLYFAQTPQSFKFKTIFKIHKDAYGNKDLSSTDDIQLASRARKEIFLVRGSKRNIKVTTPEDLQILGALLTTPKF